jgi:hypothetical protein
MPDLPSPLSHISYGAGIHDMLKMKIASISLAGSYYWSLSIDLWGIGGLMPFVGCYSEELCGALMLIESFRGCLHFPVILQTLSQDCGY